MEEEAGPAVLTLATRSLLLLKGEPTRVRTVDRRERAKQRNGRTRIRCPRCGWEPGRHDRWICRCFHVWNTFDTRGVCPGCGYQWLETQCLRCKVMSRHEDWYVVEPGQSS